MLLILTKKEQVCGNTCKFKSNIMVVGSSLNHYNLEEFSWESTHWLLAKMNLQISKSVKKQFIKLNEKETEVSC